MARLPEVVNGPLVDAVAARLRQDGWQLKPGKDGRKKLNGLCLFHDDGGRPNADFYPDDGWYKCWACDEIYSLDEVATTLGVELPPDTNQAQPRGTGPGRMLASKPGDDSSAMGYHNRFGWPTATYSYYFPSGRLSHFKHRYPLEGGSKTFIQQAPDGSFKLPDSRWPIYGPSRLPTGMNFVVVEGEKSQELVTQALHAHSDRPVFALTMGSAAEMKNADNRKTLVSYLGDLQPHRVLVWPDNDKPGSEWAKPLHQQLVASGIRSALVDLRPLSLDEHAGCDDFLAKGGSLDQVFIKEFQKAGGYTVDEVINQAVVTRDGRLLIPGSRHLAAIKDDAVEIAFFRMTQDPVIPPKIKQRVRTELRSKAADSNIDVFYRRWHNDRRTAFAWRSIDQGFAWQVSGVGIDTIQDPPRALLLLPPGTLAVSNQVDMSGERQDLERLCEFFGVQGSLEILEGWLLCAMVGLQTPILLLRGEAGSGKTTLAKTMVGILEPTCPQVQLTHNANRDERALILGLRQSMAVLLDNVSSMSGDSEDMLSRFVTGFGVLHRALYEDKIENISMQRAICITTTNWNMSKGDLVSRTIAVRMRAYDRYRDEDQIDAFLNPLVERIRGYLFKRAVFYYQRIGMNPNGYSSLRLAGLSRVFRALGYDAARIEQQLSLNRVRVASETDAWMNAIVDWYRDLDMQSGEARDMKLEEIKGAIEGLTDQFLPSNQKFAAFLNEASPQWRDYGFAIERHRTNSMRFWRLRCIRRIDDWGDDG